MTIQTRSYHCTVTQWACYTTLLFFLYQGQSRNTASLGATEAFRVLPMPSIRRDLRSNRSDPRTALERLVVEETHKIGISLNSLVSQGDTSIENDTHRPNIVLVAGFESFNKELYQASADSLDIGLRIFTDSEIRRPMAAVSSDENNNINPEFRRAMESADAFVGSLIFDYDDVLALQPLLSNITGPRLLFECATELMSFNHIGTFSMAPKVDDTTGEVATLSAPGPPPYVQAILSKFSSNKEEDKLSAYLKLLKIGPDLLKYVPGNKAGDLRTWLEAYRYWNQGGASNVNAMLQILAQRLKGSEDGHEMNWTSLPELEVTPDIGLLHPLLSERETGISNKYFTNPKEYINWRESKGCEKLANEQQYHLAPLDSPRVAILLYRKHVITKQRYINELITLMEEQDVLPIPIFINGVEAHTIVRDWLTSMREIQGVRKGIIQRDSTYQSRCSAEVDIIVNTIGFPLVGGPAGSMEAGRNIAVAEKLLSDMNVPYIVASPLLLQSIQQWKTNGVLGLQSVVLYSLPELDGAIDTVVLGGLVGDKIVLVNERVRKLTDRVKGWAQLRRTPKSQRKIAIMLYGFPPNVGAVGTAALLDVPKSLENILMRLHMEGYDVGDFATDADSSGESLVAALSILCEDAVIARGSERMEEALTSRIDRAKQGDITAPETLAKPNAGLGGAFIRSLNVDIDSLEKVLGAYMTKKVRKAWSLKERGPGVSASGDLVVSGLQVGNVWISVQPLLGVEGDPMRLLFEKDLTPHPQYCAAYKYTGLSEEKGGIGAQAIIHLGMHGTVEWLPGQPLGNDRESWSDELIGSLPNIYVYAANNPSESILAKRRGYGTLISYNVPPYGRAGLYLELANLRDLLSEYRTGEISGENRANLQNTIWPLCLRCGIEKDVPLYASEGDESSRVTDTELSFIIPNTIFDKWVGEVSTYLIELQSRLFSSGLHALGAEPTHEELISYLQAYFGDKLKVEECLKIIQTSERSTKSSTGAANDTPFLGFVQRFLKQFFASNSQKITKEESLSDEAVSIVSLLSKNTEELDGVMTALDGGYVRPAPGGDLLRDGTSVLPTGRNIHALDPYRMPSAGAWSRGQGIVKEMLKQHLVANDGMYPETVGVTLWGLDTIKTRGESIAIILALVGAEPVREGTGRVVRYDLLPLEMLGRPRVDVLASLSGIFRDSFANVVELLDDMFERCAAAAEPEEMNFVKKHVKELEMDGVDRPASRLFSNPPGDYGSMVNEVVGTGDWSEEESLGETWKGRNVFSYGRNEGSSSSGVSGTARPEVLDKLLSTTDRIIQEIDSVEYGLTDIQEYYANTGALKKAAENRKPIDPETNKRKAVALSVVEAFGGPQQSGSASNTTIPVRDVEKVLRMEYRSKLLNPKWRDAMLDQGSGGCYEVSNRMTAMVGWAATTGVDNFVFDQAAERYALDEDVARKLQKSNPEAFKNVVRRLLEASGRGMWEADEDTLIKLRDLYSDADDLVEQVGASFQRKKIETE